MLALAPGHEPSSIVVTASPASGQTVGAGPESFGWSTGRPLSGASAAHPLASTAGPESRLDGGDEASTTPESALPGVPGMPASVVGAADDGSIVALEGERNSSEGSEPLHAMRASGTMHRCTWTRSVLFILTAFG